MPVLFPLLKQVIGYTEMVAKSREIVLKNTFRANSLFKQLNHKHLRAVQQIRCINQPTVVLNVSFNCQLLNRYYILNRCM